MPDGRIQLFVFGAATLTMLTCLELLALRGSIATDTSAVQHVPWLLAGSAALALLSARSRTVIVALLPAGLALMVIGNYATVETHSEQEKYQVHMEVLPDRPTLDELADSSPNSGVSENLGVIFDVGIALGDAELIMANDIFAGRVRAFTDVRARAGEVVPRPSPTGGHVVLGTFDGRPVYLIPSDASTYYWHDDLEGPILIAAETGAASS